MAVRGAHTCANEGGGLSERCHSPQNGYMPLHSGRGAIVQQLLAAGAAVDAKNEVRGVGRGG